MRTMGLRPGMATTTGPSQLSGVYQRYSSETLRPSWCRLEQLQTRWHLRTLHPPGASFCVMPNPMQLAMNAARQSSLAEASNCLACPAKKASLRPIAWKMHFLAAADIARVPLPTLDVYRERLLGAIAHGDGDKDQAVLAREQARACGLE